LKSAMKFYEGLWCTYLRLVEEPKVLFLMHTYLSKDHIEEIKAKYSWRKERSAENQDSTEEFEYHLH
jgi:hypothetical protein